MEKSRGHIEFLTGEAGTVEYYLAASGDLYRAPVGNVIDVRSGNRIGRWEAPPWQVDLAMRLAREAFGGLQ